MGLVVLKDLPLLKIADGIELNAVTAETVTVAYARLAAGALLPNHSHHNEQVVNVVEGELELVVDGETHSLVPGKVMILPPNVEHSGRAVKDTLVIDVFHPVRQDWTGSSFGGYPQKD